MAGIPERVCCRDFGDLVFLVLAGDFYSEVEVPSPLSSPTRGEDTAADSEGASIPYPNGAVLGVPCFEAGQWG